MRPACAGLATAGDEASGGSGAVVLDLAVEGMGGGAAGKTGAISAGSLSGASSPLGKYQACLFWSQVW